MHRDMDNNKLCGECYKSLHHTGPLFIQPDQLNPWVKGQLAQSADPWVKLNYVVQFDNVTWWQMWQMETFSALLALCAGNSPVSGEFPTQRPATLSFDVFFDLRIE